MSGYSAELTAFGFGAPFVVSHCDFVLHDYSPIVDRAFKLCMHIRQAGVQESLAPYDPGQCLALKKFRFQGLDFLFNLEFSLQKDESAM